MRWGAQLIIERPVQKLTIPELASQLEQSGNHLIEHLSSCQDTLPNRRQLCHLIGIERWSQRRLRVALGEPFLSEEYDHYRPSNERSWDELKTEWITTRQATISLTKDLISHSSITPGIKILHNQYGPLSINAWLRYIDTHASSEAKRIK